ncbi:MAG: heavy-metal-associated domain-containing protein [Desulfobulbaceae bacterium]|nr:heavy-metal-associated domain-containing protein [Desulfobulbaceae bacterium]
MKDKLKIGIIAAVTAALLGLTINFVVAGNVSETVLQVSNLSCGACAKNIEKELRKHKGMEGMNADIATGQITIKHTAELTPDQLAELVSGVGYPAKLAPAGTAEQAATASNPGCKGCLTKDNAAKNCASKNCDVKNCDKKNCDVKNCDKKNCDKKNCDVKNCDKKNCDGKNCDSKNCAARSCDKKGCKLATPSPEKN